jgi:hypothetical protein
MMIKGPAGSGKTSLLTHYANEFAEGRDHHGVIRPVVFARTPRQCTYKALSKSILAALQVDAPSRADEAQIVRLIVTQLREQRVELLVIEDTQRVCSNAKTYEAAELINDICEDGRTPIVIAGKTKVERLLIKNDSLRRRVKFEATLRPLDWSVPAEREEIKLMLRFLAQQSWKYPCADFEFDDDMSERMSWAHGGLIGNVVQHMMRIQSEVELALADPKVTRPAAIYRYDLAYTYRLMRAAKTSFPRFKGKQNPFSPKVEIPEKFEIASMYDGDGDDE